MPSLTDALKLYVRQNTRLTGDEYCTFTLSPFFPDHCSHAQPELDRQRIQSNTVHELANTTGDQVIYTSYGTVRYGTVRIISYEYACRTVPDHVTRWSRVRCDAPEAGGGTVF